MDRKRMTLQKKRIVAAVLIAVLLLGGYALFEINHTRRDAAALEAGHDHAAPAVTAATRDEKQLWTCGMHPHIIQDHPGTCPICGMELTPMNPSGSEGIVEIDPVTIQNIGVRTAAVTIEALGHEVRTTGRFEADERALAAVSPKIGGWVEKLYVDYEGARVRKGQPLLEIYSPELVSTQEEYLLALRNAQRLEGTAAAQDAERLVEAARRRLAYWDISEGQIRELEQTGAPRKTLTLYAPASGTVTGKQVVEGQQVMPGQTLMQLADLSRLWLMVDVYEQDLAWVRTGTTASIALPYDPGRKMIGKVDYIYDALNPETRTVKARVTVPNPGLALKPGMYATVEFLGGQAAPYPVVPAEAVIRTGEEEVVILALGGGRFRPVEVEAGTQAGGKVQILRGLQGGEEVVTSAQFLIDSEARLQSAVGAMVAGHDHGAASGTTDAGRMVRTNAGGAAAPQQGGAQVVRITVGAAGYEPQQVELEAGRPARLVFTRTAEGSCIQQVQVPAFGIEKTTLPLNEPVTVAFTPEEGGTFTFVCGMDMLEGTILVSS